MRWLTVMMPGTPVPTLLIGLDVHPRVIMRVVRMQTRRSRWRSGQIPARRPHVRRCAGLERARTDVSAVLCCRTCSSRRRSRIKALLQDLQLKTSVQNQNMHLTRRSTVGVTGFEPATSSSRTKRATKLRHTPYRTEPRRV
jgi:hypothetical protein